MPGSTRPRTCAISPTLTLQVVGSLSLIFRLVHTEPVASQSWTGKNLSIGLQEESWSSLLSEIPKKVETDLTGPAPTQSGIVEQMQASEGKPGRQTLSKALVFPYFQMCARLDPPSNICNQKQNLRCNRTRVYGGLGRRKDCFLK